MHWHLSRALYPIVRRHSEPAALGFPAARVLEAAIIVVGVVAMLSVVTLRARLAGPAGTDAASLIATDAPLVAIHDWAFLLGPGVIPAINTLFLGWVLYRTALVPRVIPAMGLAGAPLLFASPTATMFGLWTRSRCSRRSPRCRSPHCPCLCVIVKKLLIGGVAYNLIGRQYTEP